jgi:hypothetical protein
LILAVRDARYLGAVPAEAIIDRRNDEPLILLDEGSDVSCEIEVTDDTPLASGLVMPSPPSLNLDFTAPQIEQRYQIVNRLPIGPPDRHPKGTPSFCALSD